MPNNIICLSRNLKKLIGGDLSENDKKKLQKVPACRGSIIVNFGQSRRGKTGKPRKKTVYHLHISDCMKAANIKKFGDAPAAMRKCATNWRENKVALTEKYGALIGV